MSDRYEVSVSEVLRVVQQLSGLTTDIGNTTGQLAGLTPPVGSYGVIGAQAGAAAGTAQAELAATLKAMEMILAEIGKRVQRTAEKYADADKKTSAEFLRIVDGLPRIGR
ncbi:type VII secretion target [Catenuloplanes japonicus]|uniref:type VII secretion target n=1 Tax=Catenuloplanes japonicus TaxID=33876 RepID=UPI0005249690|nr:type VII secretion target [Catenuloplanes japonicus]